MAVGILGRKIGMTTLYREGFSIPVTVIEAGPCSVVQVKTADGKDGYNATQVGYLPKKVKRVSKPMQGHFKRAGIRATRILREFREMVERKVGETLTASDFFKNGDRITIRGQSKGRGFAGVIKRYGFSGHKASHGTHESFRGPGSIGACAFPSKVVKGKRMAGHYGNQMVTLKDVQILEVIPEKNILLVKGPVPGARNSIIELIKN